MLRNSLGLVMCGLLMLSSCFISVANDADTNVYALDLTGKGTLTEVYAAGLRPRRWDSSLADECFVEDKLLTFKIAEGKAVAIYASHCAFRVFPDGRLNSVQALSPDLPIEAARQWMLPIVKILNSSTEQLDAYLEMVGTGDRQKEQALRIEGDGSGFSVGTEWPGAESDLPALGVSLRWRWDTNLPIAMSVTVTWARPYSVMRLPARPLEAPPGFEQFPIVTESFVAEARRKQKELAPSNATEPAVLEPEPSPATGTAVSEVPTNGASPTAEAIALPPGHFSMWIFLLGGAFCCACAWLFARRNSSS